MCKFKIDLFGLLLKISGTVCLFLGMCLASYFATRDNRPGEKGVNMDGYGGAYLGIGVSVITFEVVNMVACYALGWVKDKNLDIVWQGVSGGVALCLGFMYCNVIHERRKKCSRHLCHEVESTLIVLTLLLPFGAGVLFILAAVYTKPKPKPKAAESTR